MLFLRVPFSYLLHYDMVNYTPANNSNNTHEGSDIIFVVKN